MAKARLYALNVEILENSGKARKYVRELKGQAKVIFSHLRENLTPRLASEITETCPNFETRQDKYRVVLYYILVFKSRGLILTSENIEIEENEIEEIETEMEN